jgi:O-antigen/teichoic acid export membrane protein
MNLKESLRFLAKDSMFYGIATSILKVAPLLIYPILNRLISIDGIGSLDIAISNAAYFIAFITLGLDSGVARFYYKNDNLEYRKKIISSALMISLVSTLFLFILTPILYNIALEYVFNKNSVITNYWLIYLFSIPAQSLFLFSQTIFKYRFERKKFLTMTLGFTVSYIGLFYLFIYVLNLEEKSILYSSLISYYIFAFVGLYLTHDLLDFSNWKTNIKYIKKLLKYSLPFAFVSLFSMLILYFDRIVLFKNLGSIETAYYSNAIKVASIFGMVIAAFSISSGPFIMSRWKEKNFAQIISRILNLYLLAALIGAIVFLFFKNFLIDIFCTSLYRASGAYIPILIFSQILEGLFIFSFIGLIYAYKSWYTFYIYMAAAIFSMTLNFALIPYLGIWGALLSLIFSKLVIIFFSFIISNKYMDIKFNFGIIIAFIFSATLVSYYSVLENNLMLSIILALNVLLFMYLLYENFFNSHKNIKI